MSGMTDVIRERLRQKRKWGDEHDSHHKNEELVNEAVCLLKREVGEWRINSESRRHQLVIAAALIIAEIDRLDYAVLDIDKIRIRKSMEQAKSLLEWGLKEGDESYALKARKILESL